MTTWYNLYIEVMQDHKRLLVLMIIGFQAAHATGRSDVAFNLTQNGHNAAMLFSSLDFWSVEVPEQAVAMIYG